MNSQAFKPETNFYLKLIVKSSLFVFIATIISKLFSYGYKILIARYFGAETYGLFSLSVIIISIASSVATLGLYDGLVRFISFYRGKKSFGKIRRLVISSQTIFIVTGIIFTGLLIFFAPTIGDKIFHTNKFTPLFIGMSLALPFLLLANLFLGVLRGFERIKTYSALVNIYQNAARFIIMGALIMIGTGAIAISISYVFAFVGLFFISRYYARKDLEMMPRDKTPSQKKVMPEVLTYAWPLLFVGMLYSIFYWTDSLILGYFTSAEFVGKYNSAITLASLFGLAPDLFMQLFLPLISTKFSQGKNELIKNLTQQVIKWIYMLGMPLFVLMFIFPERLIELFFGLDFANVYPALRLLSIGAFFSSTTGILVSLLSIKGRTKLVLINFMVFAIINIILDLVFVKKYGMNGVAFATLITQLIFVITTSFQVKKTYGFNPVRVGIIKLLIIGTIILNLGTYLSTFSESWLSALSLSIFLVLIYVCGLYLSNFFDAEDLGIIKNILDKIKFMRSISKPKVIKRDKEFEKYELQTHFDNG